MAEEINATKQLFATKLDELINYALQQRAKSGNEIPQYSHSLYEEKRLESPSEKNNYYFGAIFGALAKIKTCISSASETANIEMIVRDSIIEYDAENAEKQLLFEPEIKNGYIAVMNTIINAISQSKGGISEINVEQLLKEPCAIPTTVIERENIIKRQTVKYAPSQNGIL